MKYKKIALIVPMLVMINTPAVFSPAVALAAEPTTSISQNQTVLGYRIKDGIQTPIYPNGQPKIKNFAQSGSPMPAVPTLPSDPNAAIPVQGEAVLETGEMGNMLYFDGSAGTSTKNEKLKFYLLKKDNGTIEYGGYNPDTFELYPFNVQAPQDDYGRPFDGNTKVKREVYYKKLGSGRQDNAFSYKFSEAIKHGVTTSNLFSFTGTVGWKLTVKAGGSVIPAEVTQEFSTSLSTMYSHTIAVSDEQTITNEVTIGPVNNASYSYPYYQTAVYQLMSSYTCNPGSGLQQFINDHPEFGSLAHTVYEYKDNEYLSLVTPGSHTM